MPSVYFVTHPEVQVDPTLDVTQWALAERGRSRATALGLSALLDKASSMWCSTERKAVEAADLMCVGRDVARLVAAGLGENDRSATGYLPPVEFECTADTFFARPDQSTRGWETARHAQRRRF